MEIRREDLALLTRFFGAQRLKTVEVYYERRISSKVRILVVTEDGIEKVLRIYITKNKILIF